MDLCLDFVGGLVHKLFYSLPGNVDVLKHLGILK